jgi:hypothetical protein
LWTKSVTKRRPGVNLFRGKDAANRPSGSRFKKHFSVRPGAVSLTCWPKDSGDSVTAICTALGWHRATFYRRLQAGQESGSPALTLLGSRDPVGDGQILASIKEIKQGHPFWGYRRARAQPKYREGRPVGIKRVYRLMKEDGPLVPQQRYRVNRQPTGRKP